MKDFLDSLVGKRTYIVAVIIAVLNLLVALNVVSVDQLSTINVLLGALGLGTLRNAIK